MPTQETFEALGAARPLPATDLIILKKTGDAVKILLTIYDAGVTKFVGRWHIPGGYVLPNRTLAEDCAAIAIREFGVGVQFHGFLGAEKWTREEHSHGQPVSLYMHCVLETPVMETTTRQFFPVDQLPENMIESQRRFITELSSDLKLMPSSLLNVL
jgi:ADP-ribose pyrophosphatase YjhB (NUDIX family)